MRLLVIEDDQKAARLLAKGLREERFVVDVAHSGELGDQLASTNTYAAIILDLVLPGKDGIAVCRDLRSRGNAIPILMLTARDALQDRVRGLNTGADDYLTKPFAFSELLARLHALLRRSDLSRPMVLTVADLMLEQASHRVTRAGQPVHLTRTEYGILEVLMRHAAEVVKRSVLGEHVWETEVDTLSSLLDVHVGNLRRKIDVAGAPSLIHTIRGHGYLFGVRDL
jgi:DNA-binding response OmpR family regulator